MPAVDGYEFNGLPMQYSQAELEGLAYKTAEGAFKAPGGADYGPNNKTTKMVESRPHFYE